MPDASASAAIEKHEAQILEELNVKAVELIARDAELVAYRIKPNLPRIGKRYGKLVPAIRAALQDADTKAIAASVARDESVSLAVADQTLTFEPEDLLIETESAEGYASAEEGGYLAALDVSLTPELIQEGIAREIVRTIQDARKQAGLEIADRIDLCVQGDVDDVLAVYQQYIMSETLADIWHEQPTADDFSTEKSVDGRSWTVAITRI